MSQTPSGILSLPLANLKTLVARTPSFQSWVGAANDVEAKDSIHLVNLPEPVLTRPFALIGFGEKWKEEKTADFFYQARGELFLLFESDVSDIDKASESDAVFSFMNKVGAVVSEMLDLSGFDGNLDVVEMEMNQIPERTTSDDSEFEDYYTVEFNVIWSGI